MNLLFFTFSGFSRLAVLVRVLQRKWSLKLPAFTVFVLTSVLHTAAVAYIRATGTLEVHQAFHEACAPWLAGVRAAATLEAFSWFAYSLPRFRRPGLLVLALCLTAGLLFDWFVQPDRSFGGWLARLEMWSAVGLGITLLTAIGIFELIGAANPSAVWHAGSLAALSLIGGIGWLLFQWKLWQAGGYVVTLASPAFAFLWLSKVNEPPSWEARSAKSADWENVDRAWNRAGIK